MAELLDNPILRAIFLAREWDVWLKSRNGDRVDELRCISAVETKPCRFSGFDLQVEMERTFWRLAVTKENQMLTSAERCTGVAIWYDTHALHALWHTHLGIEDRAVGGDKHATDVVCRERHIGNLYPRLTLTVFILQILSVVR